MEKKPAISPRSHLLHSAFLMAGFLFLASLLLPAAASASSTFSCEQHGSDLNCRYYSTDTDVAITLDPFGDASLPDGYTYYPIPDAEGEVSFVAVCTPDNYALDSGRRRVTFWYDWFNSQLDALSVDFYCLPPSALDSATGTAAAIQAYTDSQEWIFAWASLGACFVLFLFVAFRRRANLA